MAWGKLLGATLPAWLYAAWFGLAALLVSSVWEMLLGHQRGWHMLALAALWGLGLQAWSMNAALLAWSQPSGQAPRRGLGVLLALLTLWPALRLWSELDWQQTRLWWGLPLGGLGLAYLGGALVLGLGLLTLWRQLCPRLDVATMPWAWPLGLVLLAGFGTGLWQDAPALFWQHLASLALLATAFIALQHMTGHARAWRQVYWSAQQRRWHDALCALPLWPVSWLLALAAAAVAWGLAPRADSDAGTGAWQLLVCLQLLRDALVLTGLALREHRLRAPRAVFLITWLVLNAVLPLLALGLWGSAAAAALQPLAVLVAADHAPALARHWAWLALLLQLLGAAGWVLLSWRRSTPQRAAGPAAASPGGSAGSAP